MATASPKPKTRNKKTKKKKKTKASSPRLKQMTVQVKPRAQRAFRRLALDGGTTGIVLIAEALNLLFKKHKRPQVA